MKDRNDQYWQDTLTKQQYQVLRQKGTEAPGSGKLLNNEESGDYSCVGCGAEIFSSDAKFDSSSGWPSFTKAIVGAVEYVQDDSHGMTRTEVTCSKCGGHLGHVFDDGPQDEKRYCINSVCLDFKKDDK